MNVFVNNVLYIISNYAMYGVLLHLIYKASETHFNLILVLFLVQQILNLLLSSKLDTIRAQIKGTDNGTIEEETRSSKN